MRIILLMTLFSPNMEFRYLIWSDISYIYNFLPRFTVSCMKLVIFLLYNNLFIYQVLCTLIYRRRSLYSFLWNYTSRAGLAVHCWMVGNLAFQCGDIYHYHFWINFVTKKLHQTHTDIILRAIPWWRHQMEIFSALLAICAGNSQIPGEFPAQRPVAWSFDVFFDLRLNKRLSKQCEAGDLRRYRAHYDVTVMTTANISN